MIFLPRFVLDEGEEIPRGNRWARGFLRGVKMCRAEWEELFRDDDRFAMLLPVLALVHENDAPEGQALLVQVERDEARYCAALPRTIERLGGTPTKTIAAFRDAVLALPGLTDRLALLNRGQGWVARCLEDVLPRLRDSEILAQLTEMRDTHRANIAACGILLEGLAELPA